MNGKRERWPWVAGGLVVLLLAGCLGPHQSKIVGRWQLEDPDRISRRIGGDAPPISDIEQEPRSDAGNRMLVEFRRGGGLRTVTQMGQIDREKTGTWQWVAFDEANNTATLRCTIQGETTELEIDVLEGGNLRMVPPNMAGTRRKLEFRRAD